MNIYTGLNTQEITSQLLDQAIEKTKNNPFQQIQIICDHPAFLKEALLKKHPTLFSIDVFSFHDFCEQLLQTNLIQSTKITTIESYFLLKQIVPSSYTYHQIIELLQLFEEFSHVLPTDLQQLQDETIAYYNAFLSQLDKQHFCVVDVLQNCTIDSSIEFIFLSKENTYPKHLQFLKTLGKQANCTCYIPSSTSPQPCAMMYQSLVTNPITNTQSNDYLDLLSNTLFYDKKVEYSNEHPLLLLEQTTPTHEVQAVASHILQTMIHTSSSFHDFAIYYPNQQYAQIIESVLDTFDMPYNQVTQSSFHPLHQSILLILKYLQTSDVTTLFEALNYGLLSCSCNLDYIKKQWQEYHLILDETLLQFKSKIDDYFMTCYKEATSFHDFSTITITVITELFRSSVDTAILINFIGSLDTTVHCTQKEFYTFIENQNPLNQPTNQTLKEHIYLYSLEQPYAFLNENKYVYLVGNNETILPSKVDDTLLLLDKQRKLVPFLETSSLRLYKQQLQILGIFLHQPSHFVVSYSIGTLDGSTLLPSSLVLQLKDIFKPTMIDSHSLLQNKYVPQYYSLQGFKDTSLQSTILTDKFVATKNQKPSITRPLQDSFSISQIETFNSCPFKYFYQYTMKLQPISSYYLENNELGTITHALLEALSSLFKDQESAKAVDYTALDSLIEQELTKCIEKNPYLQRKLSHQINKFFLELLKKQVKTAITVLIKFAIESTTEIISRELPIQEQKDDYLLKGIIDRVSEVDDFITIIDYKSSAKDIDEDLAKKGFNIQMLLYLDMLTKQTNKTMGATLYFNTGKQFIEKKLNKIGPVTTDEICKEYKFTGLIEEQDFVNKLDSDAGGNKKAKIFGFLPVRYVGTRKAFGGDLIGKEDYEQLIVTIEQHVDQLYEQLIEGSISIFPKGSYKKSTDRKVNPCTYCAYKGLCHFDVFYNEHEMIDDTTERKDDDDDE